MAMLAEPRQKKRYNLVPKGKPLFEDSERFGTKMLEKMGWSKGKGLGRHENGQQDFIRVRYKNDENGFGFEERDDQWTEHEKHFNGLLENLNEKDPIDNTQLNDSETLGLGFKLQNAGKKKLKDKLSGHSLEEKSKNSKARVHYKKFTKGKDMTQYSEKDLANIFGKKAIPNDTNIYDQFQAFNAGSELKERGTHIINTGVSVSDYFKTKMAALKNRGQTDIKEMQSNVIAETEADSEAPVKTKKSKKRTEVELELTTVSKVIMDELPRKKKKKIKKQDDSSVENESVIPPTDELTEKKEVTQEDIPVKNKQIKKTQEIVIKSDGEDGTITLKKKKNKKRQIEEIELTNGHNEDDTVIPLKEKKSKNEITDGFTDNSSLKNEERNAKKNKKKPKATKNESKSTEKFRNVDLTQFNGSNALQINGYGLGEDLKLNIKMVKNDQERILKLWSGCSDKYQYATPKRKIYSTYMMKAHEARKAKNRIPKMNVKCLKRKHVFQCL